MSEREWEAFINLDKLEIEDCRKIDEGSKKDSGGNPWLVVLKGDFYQYLNNKKKIQSSVVLASFSLEW